MNQNIGFNKQRKFLERAAKQSSMANTYAILGEQGIGIEQVAEEFLSTLLNTTTPLQHQDTILAKCETASMPVKEMRSLLSECHRTPFEASVRVLYIPEAWKLSRESSNALLKTLEEPPSHLITVLMARHELDLLPTIHSRAVCVRFQRPSREDYQELNQNNEQKEKMSEEVALLSDSTSFGEQCAKAKSLAQIPKEELIQSMRQWCLILEERLSEEPQNTKFQKILLAILEASTRIQSTNANTARILERMFLNVTS